MRGPSGEGYRVSPQDPGDPSGNPGARPAKQVQAAVGRLEGCSRSAEPVTPGLPGWCSFRARRRFRLEMLLNQTG